MQNNPLLEWWRVQAITNVDHRAVMNKVQSEAIWSGRCAFMTLMSAGIAVLGLLLSSPAVVIGAMLISPLMGPIIGLGFGLATSNVRDIRKSALALAFSVALAVLFCTFVASLSPLQNVTPKIAARTRPNLFDLMIALFSALAGSYAMIRGREGTIVGVAIATALMPPLGVVGFGLATGNWTVFGGAFLLFLTNLMTIALSAAVMARLYGFGSRLSPEQTLMQTIMVVALFIALAIPLALSLSRIAWETNASRRVREVVASQFADNARISQLDITYTADPLRVSATVLTPKFETDTDKHVAQLLKHLLGQPVSVTIEQYRVGTSAQAEAAEIANAKAQAQEDDRATAQQVMVAGVGADSVLVDRDNRLAQARATPLSGAVLSTYRTLEQQVAAQAPGWTITLIPHAARLPQISLANGFDANGLNPVGMKGVAVATWGARRIALPIGVSGPKPQQDQVVAALTAAGVRARALPETGAGESVVTLSWLSPEDSGTAP